MNPLNTTYAPQPEAVGERPLIRLAQARTTLRNTRLPAPRVSVRATEAHDVTTIERIWSASQDVDEPAGRPPDGWWSITSWATATSLLIAYGQAVGFAAVEYQSGTDVAEGRIGLLPQYRSPQIAASLIEATLALAEEAGAPWVRLYMPEAAHWARDAARERGFTDVRTQHIMLRLPDAARFAGREVEGVHIRALRDGKESELLTALNRAWADTWNTRPLSAAALTHDLEGQRAGMLVAIDPTDETRIVATVHALVNPSLQNPDGQPYAWISNLTTDPAWRGRGLGRAMLAAGLEYLRAHGARSVALGVDGGNAVAITLYHAAGFTAISTVIIAERLVGVAAEPTEIQTKENNHDRP